MYVYVYIHMYVCIYIYIMVARLVLVLGASTHTHTHAHTNPRSLPEGILLINSLRIHDTCIQTNIYTHTAPSNRTLSSTQNFVHFFTCNNTTYMHTYTHTYAHICARARRTCIASARGMLLLSSRYKLTILTHKDHACHEFSVVELRDGTLSVLKSQKKYQICTNLRV
jgi:hypothetical protein